MIATALIALALVPAPDLQARLPVTTTVKCGTTETWAETTGHYSLSPQVNGFTPIEEGTIVLAPWVCSGLRSSDDRVAYWYLTLYHEFIHAAMATREEGTADCIALFMYRYWLRKYFSATPQEAQAMYDLAWSYHKSKPAAYQGTCTYEPKDAVSPLNGF